MFSGKIGFNLSFRKQKESDYIEELRVQRILNPPLEGKPCCLFVVTDPGESAEDCLSIVGDEFKSLGMKLVSYDSLIGAHAKGKLRGDVIKDQKGVEDCRKLIRKLIDSTISNIQSR